MPSPARTVLEISGKDHVHFLNGLVTNALPGPGQISYGALLTPQGRFLFDFFMIAQDGAVWLDVASDQAPALAQRLSMYKLRAEVSITVTDLQVIRGLGDPPDGALADPRHDALGWRLYGHNLPEEAKVDWEALRVAHCIPQTGAELTDKSFILEAGFERINGVDFRKGCYVGQEVTARMKHKTTLRKGLVSVGIDGAAEPGTPITSDGRPVGELFTRAGDRAIAYLRFDKAKGDLKAGTASVTWDG